MKSRIALLLCVVLVFSSTVSAYATGAEGIIIGGGAEAAGLALTGPEVALLVAGLMGAAYAVDHADDVYKTMVACANTAVSGLENGAEVVSDWFEKAKTGVIDTTSDVWGGICDWFSGASSAYYSPSVLNYSAGSVIDFKSTQFSANADCVCVPFYTRYSFEYDGAGSIGYKFVYGVFFFSDSSFRSYGGSCGSSSYNSSVGKYVASSVSYYWSTTSFEDLDSIISKHIEVPGYAFDCSYYGADYVNYIYSLLGVGSDVLHPDTLVGGINGAINSGAIDSAADVIYPDTVTLDKDGLLAGAKDVAIAISDAMAQVIDGTLTWRDYWERVTTNSLPGVLDIASGIAYELDNKGVSKKEMAVSSSSVDKYKLDLTDVFPFCIPFDLYDLLSCLCAEPEAPKIKWVIPLSSVGLNDYTVELDLAAWDSVAQLVRNMELLGFCIGLAFVTRNLIRG